MGNDISSFFWMLNFAEMKVDGKNILKSNTWWETLGRLKNIVLGRVCQLPPSNSPNKNVALCRVYIFELSCPTGYLRVKHFSLMSSRVFVAFLLCDIGANDGFNRVPGWFSWLSWYNACTELSCAIVFAMTWHRSPLLRSKRVESCRIFSPNLT